MIKKISPLFILLLILVFACKKDENTSDNTNDAPVATTYSVINYTQSINATNVLISGITNDQSGSVVSIYGDTDFGGYPQNVSVVAYNEPGNDTTVRVVLDENYLITSVYYEVAGVKNPNLMRFTYPAPNQVGVIVSDFNWDTNTENVLKYAVADLSGEVPEAFYLRRGGWIPGAQAVASAFVNVVSAVATVGLVYLGATVSTPAAVVGAILLVLANTNSASASELPLDQANTGQPTELASSELPVDPCVDSGLTVTVGIDPGNELVALATGTSSSTINFYWSNGETGTGSVYHTIIAEEPGVYYVLVIDETGCFAVGSVTVTGSPIQALIDGSPWRSSAQSDGSYEIMRIYGQDCYCWTDSVFNAADEVISSNGFCFSYDTDSLFYISSASNCPSLSGTSFQVTSIGGNSFTCLKAGVPTTYTRVQ